MRGSDPYQRCSCRDPVTRKPLGKRCPKLKAKGHALGWFFRYDAPRGPGGKRRRPEVGPFATQKAAQEELSATLARLGGGAQAPDRSLIVAAFLDNWLAAKKLELKPRTYDSYVEAVALYFRPAVGHLRLVDLRDFHLQELVQEMLRLNCPLAEGDRSSELLRRLTDARADDERRILAPGEKRRKKSTRPLTPARIAREFAVIRTALNDAVPAKILVNPFDGVVLPKVRKVRPLAWTAQRETAFQTALDKRTRADAAAEKLTSARKQVLWAARDLRPCPVMVWLPGHTGRFLDAIAAERMFALFCVVAYCGLRRDEVLGLTWAEVDLDEGVAWVLETGSGNGPKSEAGVRAVPLPSPVVQALKAWRAQQAADRLAWGPDWPDTDLVFTREDGCRIPGQWVSVRFETLAYRAGLPPIAFTTCGTGPLPWPRPPGSTRSTSLPCSATPAVPSPTTCT